MLFFACWQSKGARISAARWQANYYVVRRQRADNAISKHIGYVLAQIFVIIGVERFLCLNRVKIDWAVAANVSVFLVDGHDFNTSIIDVEPDDRFVFEK